MTIVEIEARLRALEEAFRCQALVLNTVLRGYADKTAVLLGDVIDDLPPHERAGHYGQALLELRYHLQALGEIDEADREL